jgi:hypothetical protein
MCKILSIDTDEESDYKGPVNTADLTTLEALAFGYDVQVSILFSFIMAETFTE